MIRYIPIAAVTLISLMSVGCKKQSSQCSKDSMTEMEPNGSMVLLQREEIGKIKKEAAELKAELAEHRKQLKAGKDTKPKNLPAPGSAPSALDGEVARILRGEWKSLKWHDFTLEFASARTVRSKYGADKAGFGEYDVRNGVLTLTRYDEKNSYRVDIISDDEITLHPVKAGADIYCFGDCGDRWKRIGPPTADGQKLGALQITCDGPIRVERGRSLLVAFKVSGRRTGEDSFRLHNYQGSQLDGGGLRWQTAESKTWHWKEDGDAGATWAEHRAEPSVSVFHARLIAGPRLAGLKFEMLIEHPKSGATWMVPVEVIGDGKLR